MLDWHSCQICYPLEIMLLLLLLLLLLLSFIYCFICTMEAGVFLRSSLSLLQFI